MDSIVDINVQNKKILQEKSFKYLGVTLTSDLTWHEHVDNMMTKINQRLGVLRRIKEYLDLNTHCVLYTSLILPLFDYGDIDELASSAREQGCQAHFR